MKLRKKIVIFICTIALLGLGSTYLFLHLLLLNRFERLDETALQAISVFRVTFFAITILMCLASLVFINRFLLGPMSSLIRNIRNIGNSKDLSIRIKSSSRDEFSEVEFEFNRMIDSLEQAQEELRQQAMLDPLTQLPNRSLFFAKLNEAIASAKGTSRQIVLVFIDLDHFKTVNDTLGHDFGDDILRDIASRLSQVIGGNDVISRLGGDEFTILLSDITDSGSIEAQLKKIQEVLTEPHLIQGHLLYNTASIGVSIYPQNGEDADYLVKQADLAMLHVKETGRNNIFQYSEVLEESIRRKKILSQQLLSAAANQEFEIHYQPILSSGSLQVSKLEALLRWTSPTYGPVSPGEFIPLAESSGAIIHIGSWVLRQVCSDLCSFRESGLQLSAAVNISAMQLMQPGLQELLLGLLDEYELASTSIELEITESVLASGDIISGSVRQLREHGFRISLDDFGTGFSSLSYLRRFPVDVVKIDRSFVAEMTPDSQGDILVKAIIDLSHNLGLRVVSEGVELKEQFDLLRQLGSDELQGYFISRPVQASAVYSFLTKENPGFDKK
ncbi:GGDEF domain-containing protein [Paenibacillus sp. PK3_47]|uniref:putative bifunctional diguanylate cyclase/phosphodiesterase n=1 Tax=Paenibacillus sp. PK3_47 TaxID=2072642 RepID=UPI00201E37BA|nr:EAL domain-containing protein [Paenibacillus sp. PK3_47]UQZ33958.1 GGDEF domain-containing protein [Paenibacillus sp. PK3_47]